MYKKIFLQQKYVATFSRMSMTLDCIQSHGDLILIIRTLNLHVIIVFCKDILFILLRMQYV